MYSGNVLVYVHMEDLNKNQIILLTLLVSFVTSIATGIMTVSLLQQAPVEVTQTINRVVEKTIETVVPGTVTSPPKEVTTVIVKEEDLVIASINKNIQSIARIRQKDAETGAYSFYGIGMVVTKDGMIAADRKTISSSAAYYADMSDGTQLPLTPIGVSKDTNFIIFKASQPEKAPGAATSTPKTVYTFSPAIFAGSEPQLGQTLIGLGGETKNAIAVGRVISLDTKDSGTGTSTVTTLVDINIDSATKDLVNGSPVFNLSGDLVGIRLSSDPAGSFTPISVLKRELPAITEVPKTP